MNFCCIAYLAMLGYVPEFVYYDGGSFNLPFQSILFFYHAFYL